MGHDARTALNTTKPTRTHRKQQDQVTPNASQHLRNVPDELLLKIYGYLCEHPTPVNAANHDELLKSYVTPSVRASSHLGDVAREAFYSTNEFTVRISEPEQRGLPRTPCEPWYPPELSWHWIRRVTAHFYVELYTIPNYNRSYWDETDYEHWELLQEFGLRTRRFPHLKHVRLLISIHNNRALNYGPPYPRDYLDHWDYANRVVEEMTGMTVGVKTKQLEVEIVRHQSRFDRAPDQKRVQEFKKRFEESVVGAIRILEE